MVHDMPTKERHLARSQGGRGGGGSSGPPARLDFTSHLCPAHAHSLSRGCFERVRRRYRCALQADNPQQSRAPTIRFALRIIPRAAYPILLSNLRVLYLFLRYQYHGLRSYPCTCTIVANHRITDKPLIRRSSLSHGNKSIQLCLTPHLDLLHTGEDKAWCAPMTCIDSSPPFSLK